MGIVLQIDHDSDLANQYAQAFRDKHVFGNFASQYPQHSLVTVINADAIEQQVTLALQKNSIDYVSASGHGTYQTFFGSDSNLIWDAGQSLNDLKDKIVHLLACETGAVLGRAFVERGAYAFWGYTVSFAFVHEETPTSLEDDGVAEAFLKMDLIIDRGILSGKTGVDIYDSIVRYVARVLPNMPPLDRGLLLSNFVHLAGPVINWGDDSISVP